MARKKRMRKNWRGKKKVPKEVKNKKGREKRMVSSKYFQWAYFKVNKGRLTLLPDD